jgi:hypothetical protein
MPRATVSTEAEMYELKSCPGGWVKLRRMSYGERLHRQDMAMAMSMETDQRKKTASMDVRPMQTIVAAFELRTCVVDHNLEDENERKLNFASDTDCSLLDGRIGEEIAQLIEDLHNWDVLLPNSDGKFVQSSGAVIEKQGKRLPKGTIVTAT